MNSIRKVAVFGAGVMGASIAAHVANAGVPVMLFDVASRGPRDRSNVAAGAITRLAGAEPQPLMHKRNLALITPRNIDDDMGEITQCDWIVEAIVEQPDAKRQLYRRIDEVRRPGAVVSSNTSTIPLATLIADLPDSFAERFLITHFFNPPRYQRLLEIVPGVKTRADALTLIEEFADLKLGKTPIRCKDTPGFIANRIGIYWLLCAVTQAMDLGLTVEEADAVLGAPIGAPKTGVFGLLDMVGIDLMPNILASMVKSLPKEDAFHAIYRNLPLIETMVADGYTGRKGKGGFYRLRPGSPEKIKEVLDLDSGEYRASSKVALESVARSRRGGLRALLGHPDKGGHFAWAVLARTLSYAAGLLPEIADDVAGVDEAMRLGYNWKHGPFELIDKIGTGWFIERLRRSNMPVPPLLTQADGRSFYRKHDGQLQYLTLNGEYSNLKRREGVLLLSDIKNSTRPIKRNPSASLWDIGDGVLCLEFHSKMNALDPLSLRMINQSIRLVEKDHRALVIYNEASNFSVGANIWLLSIAMKLRAWPVVRALVGYGQKAYQRLKHAPFPWLQRPPAWRLAGAAKSCSTVPPCRPMLRPTWASSRLAWASCLPGAGARN